MLILHQILDDSSCKFNCNKSSAHLFVVLCRFVQAVDQKPHLRNYVLV